MTLLPEQLQAMLPTNENVVEWCDALNQILPDYEINTPERIAMFIAQCGHESGDFRRLKENLNYRAESLMRTWPKRFPTIDFARQYANKPEMIANYVYANRMGNGPTESGDGWKYIGRGLIQITGKENYLKFAKYVDIDINDVTDYLMSYEGALRSACWFWEIRKLNTPSDESDIETVTRLINGGLNGLDDRTERYNNAIQLLSYGNDSQST